MEELDLASLLADLVRLFDSNYTQEDLAAYQQKLITLLQYDLRQTVDGTVITPPLVPPTPSRQAQQIAISAALPAANDLQPHSPAIFDALKKIFYRPIHPFPIYIEETISVFLHSDAANPAIIIPVSVRTFIVKLPGGTTGYTVDAGSIWIQSRLLCNTAPAGMYTGLTIGGGSISFDRQMTLADKAIQMPAGSVCTISLDLRQPAITTAPPDNVGIDAANANVQLPAQFNCTLADPHITIASFGTASWNLYGNRNTFEYDPDKIIVYSPDLNSIFIPCSTSSTTFTIGDCESDFFTIQGSAPIIAGYWELPVTQIDTSKPDTAPGIGSLAAVCSAGLQVNWTGLSGGWTSLTNPLLSATPGAISVLDTHAQNRYGKQHYDLWANESTGLLSTLDVSYTDQFVLLFVSLQSGEELLSTIAPFTANIDRPVTVDASPVSVKGTGGIQYIIHTPAADTFFLYDPNLLAQNYPSAPGTALTGVPQQALALTNALITVTPPSGVIIWGKLNASGNFAQAELVLSFGMFYLLPALPDPYASSRLTIFQRPESILRNRNATDQENQTLPLDGVVGLISAVVSWPQAGTTNAASPQLADTSMGISPFSYNQNTAVDWKSARTIRPADTADPDPRQTWDQYTGEFAGVGFALLDVSTNADLMGVSFSTTNIEVQSDPAAGFYTIQPVDNSSQRDILQILGLDLAVPGKFIRAFTVPEITWEPVVNLAPDVPSKSGAPNPPADAFLLFGDDGGPTQLFNDSLSAVAISPITVSNFLVDSYTQNDPANPVLTASLFTLPFGMKSFALLAAGDNPGFKRATLSIAALDFDITPQGIPNPAKKIVSGGLQISMQGEQNTGQPDTSPSFTGFTIQLRNILDQTGATTNTSVLGPDVDFIFNNHFQPPAVKAAGVPLERIDFSGYGASVFSNWQDPTASIAATSQVKFDVIVGRTSLEIVQVRSLLYPWGVRVVRTITLYRSGSALVFRVDSGWRADTDGVYDFSYIDEGGGAHPNMYTFHPGVVQGVFNVTNIIENDLPQFPAPPAGGAPPAVLLQPVYFDADVQIDNILLGGTDKRVPAKKMLGYIQLAPEGVPISAALFSELLQSQGGSLAGPVECVVSVGGSKQTMRLSSVDVSNSIDTGGNPIFVGTARGTVILPKDGSWSVVQHSQATDAVSAIINNAAVPLIREGALGADASLNQLRLANPIDLLKTPDDTTINYGLLQNTGTQKVLFQLPAYAAGVNELLSKGNNFPLAKFADSFHLLNSTGIFPNPGDIPDMDLSKYGVNLIDEGYQLLNKVNPGQLLQQTLPSPFYFVQTKDIRIYVDYNAGDGQNLNYNLDSAAQSWESSAKNITLNIGLGPFNPLMYIDGNFDSSNGLDTAFNTPQLKFSPALQPVIDILQVLDSISTGDYAAVAKKALEVAMSNSGNNFEYKFHADKEIPILQFPPAELDGPTTPLRLTAGLKVGAYFNEALSITSDPSSLIPSAGAYLEFDGGLQVMCVSLAAATVYAVGQVVLRISADVKTGPALYMKFGFGVELMVGLPVVGNVSVTYMVGIEMNLTSTDINITAFLLFKGEAQLIGGMVDITITIEASGTIDRPVGGPTSITAQVTFAIDVSIFLVIDINFSKSWSESRQIA